MGAYLSAPVLAKTLRSGASDSLVWASACHQGWRLSLEDESTAELDVDGSGRTSLFAIFDGHGGCEARAWRRVAPCTRGARAAGVRAAVRDADTLRASSRRADACACVASARAGGSLLRAARGGRAAPGAGLRVRRARSADTRVSGAGPPGEPSRPSFLRLGCATSAFRHTPRPRSRQAHPRAAWAHAPRGCALSALTRAAGARRSGRQRGAHSWRSWRRRRRRRATTAPQTRRCSPSRCGLRTRRGAQQHARGAPAESDA